MQNANMKIFVNSSKKH